jgi:hypothetical protein
MDFYKGLRGVEGETSIPSTVTLGGGGVAVVSIV